MSKRYFFHSFMLDGENYILNVADSRIERVDDLTYKIAWLLENHPKEKIVRYLSRDHSKKQIDEAQEKFFKIVEGSYVVAPSSWKTPLDYIKKNVARNVSLFDLFVADTCNLCCDYCYINDKYSRKGLMTQEIAQKALDFLFSSSRQKNIRIIFRGGEPLLNMDVVKHLIETCQKYSKNGDRNFNYQLTTNGTLLSKDIFAFLAKHNVNLGISLDGDKVTHDTARKFPAGKGTYDLVNRKINQIRKADRDYFDKKVALLSVVTPRHPDILERVKYFKGRGIKRFSFSRVRATNKYALLIEEEKLLDKHAEIYDIYLTNKMLSGEYEEVSYEIPYSIMIRKMIAPCKEYFQCMAGMRYLAVDVDGGIYSCTNFTGNEKFLLGNIGDGIEIKRVFKFYNDFNLATKKCRTCWAVFFCGRPCFYEIAQKNGGFCEPKDAFCKKIKEHFLKAFQFYQRINIIDPYIFNNWNREFDLQLIKQRI